jgi:hypothetical protein
MDDYIMEHLIVQLTFVYMILVKNRPLRIYQLIFDKIAYYNYHKASL